MKDENEKNLIFNLFFLFFFFDQMIHTKYSLIQSNKYVIILLFCFLLIDQPYTQQSIEI